MRKVTFAQPLSFIARRGLWREPVGLFLALWAASCAVACGPPPQQAAPPQPNLEDTPGGPSVEIAAAQDALAAKDWPRARAEADKVLSSKPNHAEAHFVLAVCDENEGHPEQAGAHYEAALKADPGLISAATNYSAWLIDQKQFDKAAAVARRSLERAKGAVDLHINLGYALKGLGDHAGAAKSFANALKIKPDNVEVQLAYAEELLEAKDKDGALRAYKNALGRATDPDTMAVIAIGLARADDAPGCVVVLDKVLAGKVTAELLTERSICKHKAGDLPGALKDAEAALEKDRSSLKAHAIAAKAAEKSKDTKRCREHYGEVAKLAPGTKLEEEARKGIERCK